MLVEQSFVNKKGVMKLCTGLQRGLADLFQNAVMSIKTATCNKAKGAMADGIQRYKSSG